MHRRPGVWIVVLAAACGAAAVGVDAGTAAPRAGTHAFSIDKTYSCHVRRQHFVQLNASVTLPPVQNQPQPGYLSLTTANKTVQKNGALITVVQMGLSALKDSLRIDRSSCRRVKTQITLAPKGLPSPPETATQTFRGHLSQRCQTTAQVLVGFQVKTTSETPTRAVLSIRNDDAKRRPVAVYDRTPHKVSGYAGKSCVDN